MKQGIVSIAASGKSISVYRILIKLISLCGLALFIPAGLAADIVITMEYQPDSSRPNDYTFKNLTPVTGYCAYYPRACGPGEYSVKVPGRDIIKMLDNTSSDLKKHHGYVATDSTTKGLLLSDINDPGKAVSARFRWVLTGLTYERINEGDGNLGWALLGLHRPEGECTNIGGGSAPNVFIHAARFPEQLASCGARLQDPYQGNVRINDFSIGYRIDMPNPFFLSNGEYQGEVVFKASELKAPNTYSMGAIDYGDADEIRFIIKVSIRHVFHYRFPPGSERVRLTPPQGWGQWINGARVPDSLRKEVPFTLSTSREFKVWMQCEHTVGEGCGLRNQTTAEIVPLDIRVTLPGLVTGSGPVHQYLLTNNRFTGNPFAPYFTYVANSRSTLHFRVNKPAVEQMVKQPGSSWRGGVTLIFDSKI